MDDKTCKRARSGHAHRRRQKSHRHCERLRGRGVACQRPIEHGIQAQPLLRIAGRHRLGHHLDDLLLDVPNTKALQPTNNIGATWHKCSPEEAAKISAVGYYFIREIQKDRNVPVGLIESDWGGSPAEVWMSEAALSANPRFKTETLDEYPAVKKRHGSRACQI